MIKDQVASTNPEEIEELSLDSAHFGKFSNEIKSELGKNSHQPQNILFIY